jgi:putative transposase
MTNYRRNRVPGGSYFLTVVTYQRKKIFAEDFARILFWEVFENVQQKYPFQNSVYCLLPDHFHCIWTLPEGDSDYSTRMKELKRLFSRKYPKIYRDDPATLSYSRQKRGEGAIWHRRFWEHTIRDQADFNRCMNYIHWNPVKHKYVESPYLWKDSSFHQYVEKGIYPKEQQNVV